MYGCVRQPPINERDDDGVFFGSQCRKMTYRQINNTQQTQYLKWTARGGGSVGDRQLITGLVGSRVGNMEGPFREFVLKFLPWE